MKQTKPWNRPGVTGLFYDSKKCPHCEELLWGRSEESHEAAKKNLKNRWKSHKKKHKKATPA